jgi:hypothetical protein
MLELDKVDRALFEEFVDQDFEIALKDGTLNVRLVEVGSLGAARAGNREPFALMFRTADASVRLPQHIYAVSNSRLGALEIFLVQTAADSSGAYFEAVFN